MFPREPHRSSPRRRGRGGTSGPLVARVALTRRRQRTRGGRRRRVGVLASLRVLDASANAVRIIPAEPFALRRALEPEMPGTLRGTLPFASLARLDLSFNALDHRCLATLSALAALERLNLSDNRVDELPTNLFARHDEDAFSAFEDGLDADAGAYRDGAFAPFPSLRRLRLSRQTPRLTSRRCDWVATLARLPKLARLSVDGNALDGVRAGSNPTCAKAFRPGRIFRSRRAQPRGKSGATRRRARGAHALSGDDATTRRARDERDVWSSTRKNTNRRRVRGRFEFRRVGRRGRRGKHFGKRRAPGGDSYRGHAAGRDVGGGGTARDSDARSRSGVRRGGRARARSRGALASGALTTTRRARFGDGECDAVAAPLAGALVATLEPARSLPNAESLTLKPSTLHRETRPGFVAVRDDARPRRDDDALRFAVDDDASTRAVTRRLDDFTRAAKIRDLATSYAVAKRNDAAAKKRENSRDAARSRRRVANPFEPVRTRSNGSRRRGRAGDALGILILRRETRARAAAIRRGRRTRRVRGNLTARNRNPLAIRAARTPAFTREGERVRRRVRRRDGSVPGERRRREGSRRVGIAPRASTARDAARGWKSIVDVRAGDGGDDGEDYTDGEVDVGEGDASTRRGARGFERWRKL